MMMMLAVFAVALAASIATASTVSSIPTATALAVVSRLYTCGQGMGTAGTSVPRSGVLDPCQGCPQFIRVIVCHYQKHFLFKIESEGKANQDSTIVVVVYLTLTDPLRIQPWSQDRRNQTKSNRKSEISREIRQKRMDKKLASRGHRRDKIENTNKNT